MSQDPLYPQNTEALPSASTSNSALNLAASFYQRNKFLVVLAVIFSLLLIHSIYLHRALLQVIDKSPSPIIVIDTPYLISTIVSEYDKKPEDVQTALVELIKRFEESGYVVLNQNAVVGAHASATLTEDDFYQYFQSVTQETKK